MPPDELPLPGLAADWLRHAQSDLAIARIQPSEEMLPEGLCFHAQQAVEKALKAVLAHYNESIPRTHSIELLIKKAATHVDVPIGIEETTDLTPYATVTRYPGDYEPRTEADLVAALALAELAVSWAKNISGCESTTSRID